MSRSLAGKSEPAVRSRHPSRSAHSAQIARLGARSVPFDGSVWATRFEFRSIVLVLLLLLASGLTFDPKLYINGDNVDYILLAKRLIHSGEIWSSRKFPPFFPILLAPVQLLFGTAWIPQKIWVLAFYLASGPFLLGLAEKVLRKTEAFVVTLLGLTLIPIVEFSHYVMSEIPFLFFSLAAIVAGDRLIARKHDWRSSAGFAILSGAAFYTRTMGATLLAGAALAAAALRRGRVLANALVIAILVLVPWGLHTAFAPIEGASYLDQVLHVNPYYPELGKLNGERLIERLAYNSSDYLLAEIPNAILPVRYLSTYTVVRSARPLGLPLPAALAVLALIAAGAVRAARRVPLLAGYVAASVAVALLWPPIWASIRFVLPVLPLLFLFFAAGFGALIDGGIALFGKKGSLMATARPLALTAAAAAMLMLSAVNLVKYERETDRYPAPWASYFAAVDWAGRNLPRDGVVLDRKPNIFTLVSGLSAVSFPRESDPERMLAYLHEKKVRYVHAATIPYDDMTRILYPFLRRRSTYFDVIWADAESDAGGAILEFHPEGGRAGFELKW